jgi:hypothetical protein
MPSRIQRGFQRLGVLFGLGVFAIVAVFAGGAAWDRGSSYYESNFIAKQLANLRTIDCANRFLQFNDAEDAPYGYIQITKGFPDFVSGEVSEFSKGSSPEPTAGKRIVCVLTGTRQLFQIVAPTDQVALARAQDKIQADYDATIWSNRTQAWWTAAGILGGGFIAGLIVFFLCSAIGWAFAGFSREA